MHCFATSYLLQVGNMILLFELNDLENMIYVSLTVKPLCEAYNSLDVLNSNSFVLVRQAHIVSPNNL